LDAFEYTRRGVAEFIGTFALVFISCGAVIYGDTLLTAFAYGLVIAVFVSSFAGVSGGHFNPAVTLGFLVTRRIPAIMAGFYWVVQLGAAALAALLIKWVEPTAVKQIHYGAPAVNAAITSGKAVTIEAVCTFFVLIVVFATAVDAKGAFDKIAGLAIGFTIALGVMMAGGLTGGAFNPARAFGPELVSDYWTNAWVWYVGPLAGAALGAIIYELVYLGRAGHEDLGAPSELFTPEDVADVVHEVENADEIVVVDVEDAPGSTGAEPPTDAPA
jgi:aquaporin Z